MAIVDIIVSSPEPCLLHSKELLEHYLDLIFVSGGEGEKTFALTLLSDAPIYENQAKGIKKSDGFTYFEDGDKTVFLAKTPRGVLYSVITYLQDDLGVRFYHEDEEYIPTLNRLVLPSPRTVNPLFNMRNYLVGKTYDNVWDKDCAPKVLPNMEKNRVLDVFTPMDKERGGVAPVYGRNVSHNFHCYCPYEKYGESHPEFFAKIKSGSLDNITIDITSGIKDEDGSLDESMDVSVVKIVIEEMKKDILSHPDCVYFSLTQEDGNEYFDDAHNQELEKKYKRSGILIRFCNVVAREIHAWAEKELHRNVRLVTFAYDYASEAPVKEENGAIVPIDSTVVADSSLTIQLALFSNAIYTYFSPKQDPAILKAMREWKAIAKSFWFWGYDIDFANYYAYFDTFHHAKENIQGFLDYGIDYLLIQGCHDAKRNWQCDARSYVYDRLMWDLSLDQEQLLSEYLHAYYGPAGDCVERFIKLFHARFEELLEEGADLCLKGWGNENYPSTLPKEIVLEGLDLLKQGERALEKSGLPSARVELLRKRLYGVMTTPLNTLYLNFKAYYPDGDEREKEALKQEFLSKAKLSGEDQARESFTVEKYLEFVESDEFKIHPVYENGKWHNGSKEENA